MSQFHPQGPAPIAPQPGPAPAQPAPPVNPRSIDIPGLRYNPVSPKLTTLRLITMATWLAPALIAGIVMAAVGAASDLPGLMWPGVALTVVAVGLIVWLLWLLPRQVRALGFAVTEDDLVIRKGIMFRSVRVVPYGRMQFVDVEQGPIARALGISSVKLFTAAEVTDARIPGLPAADAARLRDLLTARGEAKLAGL